LDQENSNNIINLAVRIKRGEKEAFRQLFEQYAPKISRFAMSFLKNKTDAEELLQDVFLKLWEKRENIDPEQNIKSYIFKIAINSIYDLVRKKNLEKAFSDFSKYHFRESSENTWHEVIWNEMLSKLDQLVNRMPEQQRKIFRMSREEGLTNDEIAERLSLSKRTVENQLYRALLLKKTIQNRFIISAFVCSNPFLKREPIHFPIYFST
jgi:RNA polymerase sigma-70 factor (family 1)